MQTFGLLSDLAVVLGAALVAGIACLKLRQPVLVGYLLAGLAIGPYGLGLVSDDESIRKMAEVGVILLMFALGIEFSLAQFRPLRWLVGVGGGLYIGIAMTVTAGVVWSLGEPLGRGFLVGGLVALSSTIIVMRILIERAAIDSLHGRTMLGWLILQDLAVVPMLVAVPFLAASTQPAHPISTVALPLLSALVKVMAFLLIMYLAGTRLFPFLLRRVASMRHTEIFFLAVISLCFGTAALSAMTGLSLALGAFLAGLVLSRSDEHRQVLAEVFPIRDLFVTLFFVSIGMQFDPRFALAHAPMLVGVVVLIIAGKAVLGTAIALGLQLSLRTSLLIGLGLAQIGEFSFVLAREGRDLALLTTDQFSLTLAAALVTMLLTPLLMQAAGPLSAWAARLYRPSAHGAALASLPHEPVMRHHVVLVGYGTSGQPLTRILHQRGIPFLIVDLDRRLLRSLKARGYETLFGDGAMREVLDHAGLADARLMVVTLPDPGAARLVVSQARVIRPDLEIIVNAHLRHDADHLLRLGAAEVIRPEFEAGLAVIRAVLTRLGWPPHQIHGYLARLRHQPDGYEFDNTLDDTLTAPPPGSETLWLTVDGHSPSCGLPLGEVSLPTRVGVNVLVLRRGEEHLVHPGDHLMLTHGDALLLLGTPEQLQAAIQLLGPLQGPVASPGSHSGPS